MHRCERCGNTAGFVLDFREEVYGTVVARWNTDGKCWECDWESRRDEDGTVEYGEGEVECARCGSKNLEQCEVDTGDGRVEFGTGKSAQSARLGRRQ